MTFYHLIVIIGVILSAFSQILLKKSAMETHKSKIYEILNLKVVTAYSIFFLVIFANIFALKKGVNIKDMPILESLGYIFVPVIAFFFLSEKINKKNTFSILLIISGIIIFYL